MRCLALTTMLCALCLVAACSSPRLTDPCDVLVKIPDAPPAVNAILVQRAKPTAMGLAMHRGRFQKYGCK